jgi:hypothetical protein
MYEALVYKEESRLLQDGTVEYEITTHIYIYIFLCSCTLIIPP